MIQKKQKKREKERELIIAIMPMIRAENPGTCIFYALKKFSSAQKYMYMHWSTYKEL